MKGNRPAWFIGAHRLKQQVTVLGVGSIQITFIKYLHKVFTLKADIDIMILSGQGNHLIFPQYVRLWRGGF